MPTGSERIAVAQRRKQIQDERLQALACKAAVPTAGLSKRTAYRHLEGLSSCPRLRCRARPRLALLADVARSRRGLAA